MSLVISDRLWSRKFHRDPGLVGRAISAGRRAVHRGRHSARIVPVSAARKSVGRRSRGKADIFTPFAIQRNEVGWLGEFNYIVHRPAETGAFRCERALAEMDVLQASIATHFPEKLHLRAAITRLQDQIVGPVRRGLLILFGAVGAVLLIVCVNLANLSLARTAGRRRDLAIRAALGAGRWQLVRYILTECVCIGVVGGAAGILLASAGSASGAALCAGRPAADRRCPSGRARAAVRAGAFDPQWTSCRHSSSVARGIGRPAGGVAGFVAHHHRRPPRAGHARSVGGLRIRAERRATDCRRTDDGSFVHLLNIDKGFDADRLIAVEINFPPAHMAMRSSAKSYYTAADRETARPAGVTSAAEWFPTCRSKARTGET